MSSSIIATEEFKRRVKKLAKKHRSLRNDLVALNFSLLDNPRQGNMLKPNIYKVRLAIKSKGKGKSGGARVITYIETEVVDDGEDLIIYLITIYDKSEAGNVSIDHIEEVISGVTRSVNEEE